MPEQDKTIPQPISNARHVLENLRADGKNIPAALEKRINAMAMRLDQSGQDTSPETLQWHITQGEEHIKNIGRPDASNKAKSLSPLERYKAIVTNKTQKQPEPDLSHIEWNYERALDYYQDINGPHEPWHVCKSLIKQQRYDLIEELHEQGIIQTDKTPSMLLYAALNVDDVRTLRFIHQKSNNIYEQAGYAFYNATENGSLNCLKYLLEHYKKEEQEDDFSATDMCAYIALENNHYEIYTYMNDNHAVRDDMNRHIAVQAIEKGRTDFAIAAIEYCNANEQTIQLFMGAAAQKNDIELYKTIQSHFNVPAFSTLNDREEYPLQQFIPVVIGNGHVDMARLIMAEAPELPSRIYNGAFDVACLTGKMDGIRYLVEELDIFDKVDKDDIAYFKDRSAAMEYWDVHDYLTDNYNVRYPETAEPALPDEITDLIRHWDNTVHLSPPPGLTEYTTLGLKSSTYETLREILSYEIDNALHTEVTNDEDDEENPNPMMQMINKKHDSNLAVYKLTRLFGTPNRALDFMEKWGDFKQPTPLKKLAEQIHIPLTKSFNAKAWGDAVLKHGPEMGKLGAYAYNLPTPPNLNGSRKDIAGQLLLKGHENLDFASTCIELNVPENQFNLSLNIWSELKAQGFPEKNLPDITIDGKDFDKPGAKFYLMDNDDIRGFILGHYLDCCQYITQKSGGMPTLHGMSSTEGGFYCIEDENEKIIGAIWAWRGENDELVFDSLEHLKGHMDKAKWQKLLTAFTTELENNPSDISDFMVAVDKYEKLEKGCYKEAGITAIPKDYAKDHYRDSHRQFHVWTAKPQKLMIYEAKGHEDEARHLEELTQRLFPDNIYAYENEDTPATPVDETPEAEQLNKTFIACKNGDLLGFANVRNMESHEEKGGYYLEFVGVDPEKTKSMARHQVVAKLLEAVECTVQDAPRKDKTLHFLTHEDNVTVQRGVAAIGFEYNGREESYFNDGKAALAYSVDLAKHSLIHNIKAKRSHSAEPPAILPANENSSPEPVVQIWEPAAL